MDMHVGGDQGTDAVDTQDAGQWTLNPPVVGPIPTRPVRTVLVDVTTDTQRGFWDAPLWVPIGGVIEGGDDLWEVVSVRLRLPTASPEEGIRPVLYLYARKAEA